MKYYKETSRWYVFYHPRGLMGDLFGLPSFCLQVLFSPHYKAIYVHHEIEESSNYEPIVTSGPSDIAHA